MAGGPLEPACRQWLSRGRHLATRNQRSTQSSKQRYQKLQRGTPLLLLILLTVFSPRSAKLEDDETLLQAMKEQLRLQKQLLILEYQMETGDMAAAPEVLYPS